MFETTKEWVEMTGREFYTFVTAPENSGRYFMDLGDIVLECTGEQYREHRAEVNHHNYLRAQEEGWTTISLDHYTCRSGHTGEEVIADPSQDVEAAALLALQRQAVRELLKRLPGEERAVLEALYLSDNPKSVRQLAADCGVSHTALNKQLKKILRKIKKVVSTRGEKSAIKR